MVKVSLSDTEWYPVSTYERPQKWWDKYSRLGIVDVPAEVLARYDAAKAAFRAACKELDKYR